MGLSWLIFFAVVSFSFVFCPGLVFLYHVGFKKKS